MSITLVCRMFPTSLQHGRHRDMTDMVCPLYDLV